MVEVLDETRVVLAEVDDREVGAVTVDEREVDGTNVVVGNVDEREVDESDVDC